jgi:hypothetical protein
MIIPVKPVRNELARIDLSILVPRKLQLSADISIALDEAAVIGRIHPEDVTSWKTLAKTVRVLNCDLGFPEMSLLARGADRLLQVNRPHSSQSTQRDATTSFRPLLDL